MVSKCGDSMFVASFYYPGPFWSSNQSNSGDYGVSLFVVISRRVSSRGMRKVFVVKTVFCMKMYIYVNKFD